MTTSAGKGPIKNENNIDDEEEVQIGEDDASLEAVIQGLAEAQLDEDDDGQLAD